MATNYPGSLDTGTTLVNTRQDGDEILPSDHNDLATLSIALETKVGTGSSSPAISGQVLTSQGSGASSWQTPTSNALSLTDTYGHVWTFTVTAGGALVSTSSSYSDTLGTRFGVLTLG